ncbi:3-keto-disaccharide hydrolase [Paludisphaera rhizosphaerae]|uniref:3-keto-disaccharide hydrolase n=1 Tax=Paludisphaera rhizosphaerae TaxID=2711216 RepID=UPI0013EA32EB|nr:DUF1080 domain-containing protein [Paludisphaera rhizosphaerae]
MKRAARLFLFLSMPTLALAQEPAAKVDRTPGELIVGLGPGWRPLKEADFAHVNDEPDTWKFLDDKAEIHCKGTPVGVIRTKTPVKNFELVVEWRHLKSGGNSGVFVWAPEKALDGLKPGHLPPGGIEVQILDHGYAEQYQKSTGKKPDWFTTNGDVFPVGTSKMKPFPPLSPNGSRSFPTKNRSRGLNEWNHYYVRGINGEIRLWVNGEEVSGGAECLPAEGFLCLEAEGSPLEFKNLRIRELP